MSAAPKLGIMISAPAGSRNFDHGLKLAEAALDRGAAVYIYCIDQAVEGLGDARWAALKNSGARLFACAYSIQERDLEAPEHCTLSGMTILSDLIASTDRFLSFT